MYGEENFTNLTPASVGNPGSSHKVTSFKSVSSLVQPMIPHRYTLDSSSPSSPMSEVMSDVGSIGYETQSQGSPDSRIDNFTPPRDAASTSSSSDDGPTGSQRAENSAAKEKKRKASERDHNENADMEVEEFNVTTPDRAMVKEEHERVPYIPSYMDLSNGPELCVVCGDAATGYHYRCMTCEGCKGFFRRTIQKDLQFHCKWNKKCIIDKTTRNQCQECRFIKCRNVGMATDLVLNERQRTAKRKLIEDNRAKRKEDQKKIKLKDVPQEQESLCEQERALISQVVTAYESKAVKTKKCNTKSDVEEVNPDIQLCDPASMHQLAESNTPFVVNVINVIQFANGVPGFVELDVADRIVLLKSCCMEIMCLQAACRFDSDGETLTLHNGTKLHKSQIHEEEAAVIEPIFDFAMGLSKLKLDKAEIALLATILLLQSDRLELKEPEKVEKLQDTILGAFRRYVVENRPHQPLHWAKIIMKVTYLRTISARHAEREICIRLDNPSEIPPLLMQILNDGHQ